MFTMTNRKWRNFSDFKAFVGRGLLLAEKCAGKKRVQNGPKFQNWGVYLLSAAPSWNKTAETEKILANFCIA